MDRRLLKQQLRHHEKRRRLADIRRPKITKALTARLMRELGGMLEFQVELGDPYQFDIALWIERQAMKSVLQELIETWNRKEAIKNCRAIKEELMMKVWNPDRLERWMEAGFDPDL